MNDLPSLTRDQRKIDAEHLRLLSIFHFIGAGLAFLALLGLLGHYALFHGFMDDPKLWVDSKRGPPPKEVFEVFRWFYLLFGLWFAASVGLNVMSGLFIRARTSRMFSMIVAGLNCVQVPLGTVLGVFTLIVLMRDSVREAYEGA